MGRDAFDPPLCVGALFDAAQEEEPQEKGGPQDTGRAGQDAHSPLFVQEYFVREVPVGPGGAVLVVREFSFHPRNANFLWPDANLIGRYVQEHWERYEDCRFLELGCGTGVLSIYLRKLGLQVVSSDYHEVPDTVEENVAWNCAANHVDHHHVPYCWGEEPLPEGLNDPFDVIVANDILIYVSSYPDLVRTMELLMPAHNTAITFLLSWRRRLRGAKQQFLDLVGAAGFVVHSLETRLWEIKRKAAPINDSTQFALPSDGEAFMSS